MENPTLYATIFVMDKHTEDGIFMQFIQSMKILMHLFDKNMQTLNTKCRINARLETLLTFILLLDHAMVRKQWWV